MSENQQTIKSMIVKMGETKYTLPILSIKQSFKPNKETLFTDPSGNEMVYVHEKVYSIVKASTLFSDYVGFHKIEDGILMILENKGRRLCLLVDELLGERQVIQKPLPKYFEDSRFLNGCNILDDTDVSLVLNVDNLFEEMPSIEFQEESESTKPIIDEVEVNSVVSEDTTKDKYFTFEVCNEKYGLDITFIKEIVGVGKITKLPDTPEYAEGIVNIRGDIVPVINLTKRFSKPAKAYDTSTCIVLIEYGENLIGLIVDKVHEVVVIHESQIEPPPHTKINYTNHYLKAIGKAEDKLILLLDLEKTLGLTK